VSISVNPWLIFWVFIGLFPDKYKFLLPRIGTDCEAKIR
jgi:hypothetical protein